MRGERDPLGTPEPGEGPTMATERTRRTVVLQADDVVDDDTLHPGAIVWLGEPALRADELERGGVTGSSTTSSGVTSWGSGPVAP